MNGENNNFISIEDNQLYQRNVNPNLRGMNTQFGTNFDINNTIIDNNSETYKKYDVIPNNGLKSSIINKPHKLLLRFLSGTTGTNPINIILNEPFRDVISVKLLNGYMIRDTTDYTTILTMDTSVNFITISIDELNNNYSSSTPNGDALLRSFTTLDYDKTVTRDDHPHTGSDEPNRHDIFKNTFESNQDIKYFDPPLNVLSQLNIRVYANHNTEITNNSGDFVCKLKLIVETKEKLRVY